MDPACQSCQLSANSFWMHRSYPNNTQVCLSQLMIALGPLSSPLPCSQDLGTEGLYQETEDAITALASWKFSLYQQPCKMALVDILISLLPHQHSPFTSSTSDFPSNDIKEWSATLTHQTLELRPHNIPLVTPEAFMGSPEETSPTPISSVNSGSRWMSWFVWAHIQFEKGWEFVGVETGRQPLFTGLEPWHPSAYPALEFRSMKKPYLLVFSGPLGVISDGE